MDLPDRPLVAAEQPPLGERGDRVHAGEQLGRHLPGCAQKPVVEIQLPSRESPAGTAPPVGDDVGHEERQQRLCGPHRRAAAAARCASLPRQVSSRSAASAASSALAWSRRASRARNRSSTACVAGTDSGSCAPSATSANVRSSRATMWPSQLTLGASTTGCHRSLAAAGVRDVSRRPAVRWCSCARATSSSPAARNRSAVCSSGQSGRTCSGRWRTCRARARGGRGSSPGARPATR